MTQTKSQKKRKGQVKGPKKVTVIAVKQSSKKPKKSKGRSILPDIGRFAGGLVGMPGLGSAVGSGLSRVFGSGDYAVSQNTFLQIGVPSFSSLAQPLRFSHREFLGTVSTSTTYQTLLSINLNPGLLAPILAQISRSFTMYKFHGLMFVFNSTSASAVASTNTALGVTGMVCNYDPDAGNFVSRQEAEDYVGCQSAVPCNNLYLPIECKPQTTMLDRRFIRHGTSVKPLAETDLGVFQYFADGAQSASVAGEVWVTYDVEFFLPELDHQTGVGTNVFTRPGASGTIAGWAGATLSSQNNNQVTIDGLGKLVFRNVGYYYIHTLINFTTASIMPSFGYNYVACSNFTGVGALALTSPESQSSVSHQHITTVYVSQAGATVDAGFSAGSTAFTNILVSYMGSSSIFPSVATQAALVAEVDQMREEFSRLKNVLERAMKQLSLTVQDEADELPNLMSPSVELIQPLEVE